MHHSCVISIVSTECIAGLTNLAMIVHIFKTRNVKRKTDLLFAALGVSNFSMFFYMIVRATMTSLLTFHEKDTVLLDAVIYGWYGVLTSINLTLNLAIAYNKLCAVSEPVRYSLEKERSRLQVKLIAIALSVSAVLGVTIGIVMAATRTRVFRNWIEAVSRFLTYLLLCVMYCIIFRKVKDHNQSVHGALSSRNMPGNRHTKESREHHEDYLTKLFLGITISFLISNMPVTIVSPAFDFIGSCDSVEGKLQISAAIFFILGTAFDPIWYFFLWKRAKKWQVQGRALNKSSIHDQNGAAN